MSSSTTGANAHLRSLSISSKIQQQMEVIIIIIKAMENSESVNALPKLNRLLYRATDSLTELELELRRLQESTLLKAIQ